MSTEPQGWQAPKTNWQPSDPVGVSDMNRIEGNANAIETGSRTLDPTQVPSSSTGTLRQFLDWFANRIAAITGRANWFESPANNIAELSAVASLVGLGFVRQAIGGTAQHGQHVSLNCRNTPVVFAWPQNLAGLPYPCENLISERWMAASDLVLTVGNGATITSSPTFIGDPISASLPYNSTNSTYGYLQIGMPNQYNVYLLRLDVVAGGTGGCINIYTSNDGVSWTTIATNLFVDSSAQRLRYVLNSIVKYIKISNAFASNVDVTISNFQLWTVNTLPYIAAEARNVMPTGFDMVCYAYLPVTPSTTTVNITKTAANDPWTSSASDPTNKTTTTIGGGITVTLAVAYPGFPGERTGSISWREEILNADTAAVVATYDYQRNYWAGGSPAFSGTETWTETFNRRYTVPAGNYQWRVTLLGWSGNYSVSQHKITINNFYTVADQVVWTGNANYLAIEVGVPLS